MINFLSGTDLLEFFIRSHVSLSEQVEALMKENEKLKSQLKKQKDATV